MRSLQVSAAILIAATSISAGAQGRIAFEVTSVRANTSGERRASMGFTPAGDFTAVNQPLRVLVNIAYAIPLFRVQGMPDWFTSERFDVTAKAPAGVKMEPFGEVRGQLLRSLLEDRFKLKARLVTQEMPALILTLAREDGRLGPRLQKSTVDCDAIAAARGAVPAAGVAPPIGPRDPVCALGGSSGAAGVMCGRAVTMAQLTNGLSGAYQRPVVDRTGLDGRFDFDLGFTPEGLGGPFVSFGNRCPAYTGDKPSMSTALQEQLGIRIRGGDAPIDVLVIDSAERPAEN